MSDKEAHHPCCAACCAAREKAWEAFRADPAWVKARDASEVNGKLVEKVDSVLMTATDYSPME